VYFVYYCIEYGIVETGLLTLKKKFALYFIIFYDVECLPSCVNI
jgi:hypothetical protein